MRLNASNGSTAAMKEVGTWPDVGARRRLDELGRAADEIPTRPWFLRQLID